MNEMQTIRTPEIFNGHANEVAELRRYFENSWYLNELLFSSLKDNSTFYLSPDPLRNPLIFYHGHTAAFYINKLKMAGLISHGINEYYEEIFARGVDPATTGELDVSDQWPKVEQVNQYRKEAFSVICKVIDAVDKDEVIDEHNPFWALLMGIEHDRIHFETSSVLIRQLDVNLVERPAAWNYAPSFGMPEQNEWIPVSQGSVRLGKGNSSTHFGWDNEYGTRTESTPALWVSKNLVSNFDYLEFVQKAYNDPKYWSPEGLAWKKDTGTAYPKFWVKDGESFRYRAMFDELDMPLDWPVEVNALEAEAYCNWKGENIRLLSEPEFNRVANMNTRPDPVTEDWANLNLKFGSPCPVGYLNDPHSEVNDLYGNVWDWLRNDFEPLPGFEPHPYYPDFSVPYFDSDHTMLLGGAWATTGAGASKFYRLWFRRFFFQHAGFRLSKIMEG